MPLKHEKKAFLCILMGALTNLLTNAILIPVMHQDGAALATCISESTVLICTVLLGKSIINEWVDIKFVLSESIRCLMSSTVMFAICMIVKGRLHSNVMIMMFVPVIGAIVYFLMLIIFKEYLILNILEKLTSGFRKK
jgi:peptidoglycan biosynthesis protein MviN/MurJ (putative lipid II flippase)